MASLYRQTPQKCSSANIFTSYCLPPSLQLRVCWLPWWRHDPRTHQPSQISLISKDIEWFHQYLCSTLSFFDDGSYIARRILIRLLCSSFCWGAIFFSPFCLPRSHLWISSRIGRIFRFLHRSSDESRKLLFFWNFQHRKPPFWV